MLKYLAQAAALKAFSCGRPMRLLYRKLGNHFGAKRRTRGDIPEFYLDRIKTMIDLAKHHGIVKDGSRVLEVGTGWLHWEAITLRLFFDVQAVLFDVWDNRQMPALKHHLQQLRSRLDRTLLDLPDSVLSQARTRIDLALRAGSFEELYDSLGFRYVLNPLGDLRGLPDESFDFVVSAGVLEHIEDHIIAPLINDTFRVLKPGGWALHDIDMSDHLAYYDSRMHEKYYLRCEEWLWKLVGENKVQYINRLQKGEWIKVFQSSKFQVVTERGGRCNMDGLRPAMRYQTMSMEELQCTHLTVLLRKPL